MQVIPSFFLEYQLDQALSFIESYLTDDVLNQTFPSHVAIAESWTYTQWVGKSDTQIIVTL